MNVRITQNFSKVNLLFFILPLLLLFLITLFLYSQNALSVNGYVQIQKDHFFALNSFLGQYPHLGFNLTPFGDALVFMALVSLFIVYAPKIWEALFSCLLITLLLSSTLKNIFNVPRPAKAFDGESFIIIGQKLSGLNSLPSGHSMTIFAVLTVLLLAFMPKKMFPKIGWSFLIIAVGLFLAFTRVGVGAHFPMDVIIGCIIGYIAGGLGILISHKYKIWTWIGNTKYYPIIMVMFFASCLILVGRIINDHLIIIYYLALACLIISLLKISMIYAKSIQK